MIGNGHIPLGPNSILVEMHRSGEPGGVYADTLLRLETGVSHGYGHAGQGLGGPAAALELPLRSAAPPGSTTRLRCARCLHTIELAPDALRSRIRCTQCRRRLRIPRHVKHPCPNCGCHGQYGIGCSGRAVHCGSCGARIILPPQTVCPRRRRRSGRLTGETSAVSLLISLTLSLLAVFLCLKLL